MVKQAETSTKTVNKRKASATSKTRDEKKGRSVEVSPPKATKKTARRPETKTKSKDSAAVTKSSAALSGLEAVNVVWEAAQHAENLAPHVRKLIGLIAASMLSRYTSIFSAIKDSDVHAQQARSRVLLDAVKKSLDLELAALFLQRKQDHILDHMHLAPVLADAIGGALTDSSPGHGKSIARSMFRAWQNRVIPSADMPVKERVRS